MPVDLAARLLSNRSIEDRGYETPCWIWTLSCRFGGYGQTSRSPERRNEAVHRIAAHLWLGYDFASPLCVLHRCDVPRCFNPDHLFVGTKRDNTADMIAKGRNVVLRGESSPAAKLSDAQVKRMRAMKLAGASGTQLGRVFGVTRQHANRICRGAIR